MASESAKKLHQLILIPVVFCLCIQFVPRAVAASSKPATEKDVVETFIADVSRSDSAPKAKDSFKDAAQSMDFEEMAKRAFGESGWPKFTAGEQKEVATLFKRLIQIRFYPRWRRVFQKGHFEFISQSKQGSDSLVVGRLDLDGKKSALTFRLIKSNDSFKLVSMSVKDKDLLERTSVRLKRGLSQKGAAGLIAHLRKRTNESSKETAEKPRLEELISGGK
ncbi:MAG: hypothetical protein C0469_12255 [Cyanobacteria bacterium DS2.3.42]|nr:hypothetical protein [Cyanobacteria bacterium DS2.3.42]